MRPRVRQVSTLVAFIALLLLCAVDPPTTKAQGCQSPSFQPVGLVPSAQSGRTESGPNISPDGLTLYYNADPNFGPASRIYKVERQELGDCWGSEQLLCGCVNDTTALHPAIHPTGKHLYWSTDNAGQMTNRIADLDPTTGCWENCRPVSGLLKLPRLYAVKGEIWAFHGDGGQQILRSKQVPGNPARFQDLKILSLSMSNPPVKTSATLCPGDLSLYYDAGEFNTANWDVYVSCYDEASDDWGPGNLVPSISEPDRNEQHLSLSPCCGNLYFTSQNKLRSDPAGLSDIYSAGEETECPSGLACIRSGCEIFLDDFADGNFDQDPVWTVGDQCPGVAPPEGWRVDSGRLYGDGCPDADGRIRGMLATQSPGCLVEAGAWEYRGVLRPEGGNRKALELSFVGNCPGGAHYTLAIQDNPNPASFGCRRQQGFTLFRGGFGGSCFGTENVINTATIPVVGQEYHVRVERRFVPGGGWEWSLFVDGQLEGSAVDNNYPTAHCGMTLSHEGAVRVDDVRVEDLSGVICSGWEPCDQRPPICDADGPYVAECSGTLGTLQMDGSGSKDPEGGPLTYAWISDCTGALFSDPFAESPVLEVSGPPPCPVECEVMLTCTDQDGLSAVDSSTVTVRDSLPPRLTVPDPLVVECSAPGGTPADHPAVQAWLAQAKVHDDCDLDVAIDNDAPDFFEAACPPGHSTLVTWTTRDACGNEAAASSTLTVIDSQGPVITSQPALGPGGGCGYLWPPQHGYVDYRLEDTGLEASDVCHAVDLSRFASCRSSQPENGAGDGDSERDCVFRDEGLHLRAERTGLCQEVGRRYTMTAEVVDSCGNTSGSDPFHACVWHDRAQPPSAPFVSANPASNQPNERAGRNGSYGSGCGTGCDETCPGGGVAGR